MAKKPKDVAISPGQSVYSLVSRPISTIRDSEIVDALKDCKGLIYLTAIKLGCSHPDLDQRIKANDNLMLICKGERGGIVDKAEAKLVEAMEGGAKWAIEMILKTLGKERGYVERQEVHNLTKVQLHIVEEIVDHGSFDTTATIVDNKNNQATQGSK